MNQNYIIFTDVSTDVDAEFASQNGVKYVPMDYTLGEKQRTCDGIEDPEVLVRFYNGQREGDLTKTSQINPMNYREIFEPYAKEGVSILYLALSSGLSGTYQSAMLTAGELMEEYPEVQILPIDTLCATAGMGLLVEAAVGNQKEGMTLSDNGTWLDEHKEQVLHWFSVDDLMYLKRGGRVSAATAIVGTTLNIKPILEIDAIGKLVTFDKKRGTKAAVRSLVKLYEESVDLSVSNRVYIVHGDCLERAEEAKKMVLAKTPEADVVVMMLSPIIGAHTGPGMLAVIHWGKKRVK